MKILKRVFFYLALFLISYAQVYLGYHMGRKRGYVEGYIASNCDVMRIISPNDLPEYCIEK